MNKNEEIKIGRILDIVLLVNKHSILLLDYISIRVMPLDIKALEREICEATMDPIAVTALLYQLNIH